MANEQDARQDTLQEPIGIGGWLLLPRIGLFIFVAISIDVFRKTTIVILGPQIWVAFSTPNTIFYHSPWVPVLVIGALVQLAMLIISVVALVGIVRKKRFVPLAMIIFYGLGVVLTIVDIAVLNFFFRTISPDLANQVAPETIKRATVMTVIAFIWIPYFARSKRVKNTFVK